MGDAPDLFDYADRYPHVPGYKRRDTARQAAEEVKPKAPTLRAQCLEILTDASLTADEVAERLGKSILSIRPRITELAARGLIRDTGERRPNLSGKSAIVWGRPL